MTSAILNPQALPIAHPAQTVPFDSVETLYERYSQRIFRFILASLHDRDAAESLTQETFIRAWSAMKSDAQFRGDSSPVTWLTRIALNLVRDHTRTNRFRFWKNVARTSVDATEFAGFLPDPVTSAESALIAQEQVALVWQTVATLTERQRTVFVLRFVEELGLGDIAEITGMPMSTVKTHLYRGLAAIRSQHQAPAKSTRKESK